MFYLSYIRRNRDIKKEQATTNSQSIMGICTGNDSKSSGLLFYLPTSKTLVGLADYSLDRTVPYGQVFVYYYDEVIGFN